VTKNDNLFINIFFCLLLISLISYSVIVSLPQFVKSHSIIKTKIEPITFRAIDNKLVSISNIKTPFALFFWSSSSEPCRKIIPMLDKISEVYKDKFLIIGINNGESLEDITNYFKDKNVTFPIIYDEDRLFSANFDIKNIPTFIFIDENKIIKKISIGKPIFIKSIIDDLVD